MKIVFTSKAIFFLFIGLFNGNTIQAFPKNPAPTSAPSSSPTKRICITSEPDWCATTFGPTCAVSNTGLKCECLPAKNGGPNICFDPKNGFAANGCPNGPPCMMDSDCTIPGDLCMLANAGSNPLCQCPMGICVPTCPVTM